MLSTPPFLPFALPDIGEEEIAEVIDTLRSGWITTGPKARQFEADFARYISPDPSKNIEAVAVNSATAGLHLALEAVGVCAGDEVITTAYTFTATAEVVCYLGAHPVFVDIDPTTFNIDPKRIEAAITPKTRAIIVVHFAGLACDMAPIYALARQYRLKVIEDAAHALPTSYRGERIGALESDATVFSFYSTKTITTGEGGMIVSRHPEVLQRCRVMRLHGISRDAFDRYTSRSPAWYYEVIAPGYKYNLTDIAASIGIHQLKKADRFQQRRRHIALQYAAAFADLPVQLPPDCAPEDTHAWHLYAVRLHPDARLDRDAFIQAMSDRHIGCGVHFMPLPLQPYWRDRYQLKPVDFSHAIASYRQVVSLPLYTKMSDEEVMRVIDTVRALLIE